jgi:hypothetical protein
MQQYSLREVRQQVPGVDIDAVAEAGNRLARTLGATEPWVRIRGDQVQVHEPFAAFVQAQAARSTTTTRAADADRTPGWDGDTPVF